MTKHPILDTALRQKLIQFIDTYLNNTGSTAPPSNVTETNSAAILNAILALALPNEDQASLLKFLKDGTSIEVIEDTGNPANNSPLPVKITGTSGDINITAGDLNVQLSHTGANPDSTQIGNGTNIVDVTNAGEIKVINFAKYNQVGYSKEIAYYSGVVAGNPSGNKNVESIAYKNGALTEITKTFTYDANDDVLTITNT